MENIITKPADFFGFELGADRKIAKWDKIVDYFYKLEDEVDTIKVENMGPSTEGHPFLAVYLTSKNNLDRLEELRQINQKITDPRGLSEQEVQNLIKEGKSVIVQSMSLHASEIGGTQMAPQLAYELVSSKDEDDLRILDNVIFIMVPCFNPDGQLMVANWYDQWLGTEYEGCSLPWLYHKYSGHDNNRDAFALNLVESQYMAEIVFRDWKPHAYQDHHHMGSYGARLFIAPYSNPIRPYADPLIWRELSWYGSHMAYKLEENGVTGVLNDAQFPGWGHFGFHWITNHHNIAGMLTESASANLATPKYIDSTQLVGSNDKGFPAYQEQNNFPHPWPGGWWKLSDIVNQQKIAAWALLDVAAKNKDTVLKNAYNKSIRQTYRGERDPEYAYLIPADQHDAPTTLKFVDLLLDQGIEVHKAKSKFHVGHKIFEEGTYVVYLAQPKRGVIKHLVGQINFEDNFYTERIDGSLMAYDSLADTLGEYMGVDIVAANEIFEGSFSLVDEVEIERVQLEESKYYILSSQYNDSFVIVNNMLNTNKAVSRLKREIFYAGEKYPAGSFIVKSPKIELEELCQDVGIKAIPIKEDVINEMELEEVNRLEIGIYQRYWGGNADEGWTRLLLEQFEFDYQTIMDDDILSGTLNDLIDVLIIPSDQYEFIVDVTKAKEGRAKMLLQWFGNTIPGQYKSGIGEEGVKEIVEFVKKGGRLITLDKSCDFAIKAFNFNITNKAKGLNDREYSTHGSTLKVDIDPTHKVAYGMPKSMCVYNYDSPILKIEERFRAEKYQVFMRYQKEDILQSGRLVGEDLITDQPAGIYVKLEKGDVVMFATPVQFRAQTHGTFKLLFNCLI